MAASLLIIALTSVFLLHAGADIPIQPDFNIQKITGVWFYIAMALDKAEASPSSPSAQEVMILENGDLFIEYTYMKYGICGKRGVVFPHTDEPGKFLSPYGTSILRIVETNYESYYILHVEMQNAAALHLYTRKPEGIAREKQNYRNLAESMGFKDYQIQILDRMDLCPI